MTVRNLHNFFRWQERQCVLVFCSYILPLNFPITPLLLKLYKVDQGLELFQFIQYNFHRKPAMGQVMSLVLFLPARGVFRPGKWDKQGPEPMQPGSPKTKLSVHLSFWHLHNLLKKKKQNLILPLL